MNPDAIRAVVLDVLTAIAPELDVARLVADRSLRRQVDLDSIDWLNFLIGLNRRLGVDIPEADYGRLTTLDEIVSYLARPINTSPCKP